MRFIRSKQLAVVLGVSAPTIWRWRRSDPTFPRPYRLGPNAVGYDEAEVLEWVAAKRVDPTPEAAQDGR